MSEEPRHVPQNENVPPEFIYLEVISNHGGRTFTENVHLEIRKN